MSTSDLQDHEGLVVYDHRGHTHLVDVATSRKRARLPDGNWGDWEPGQRTLSLDGEPLRMLDVDTLEVVRSGERLSLHPPQSGG